MSNTDQGCVGQKTEFDKYASLKSGGNLLLSGGLLADNLTELVDLYKAPPELEPYRTPLMVLLYSCLILNIACIVLSLILGTLNYPSNNTYDANVIVPSTLTYSSNDTYDAGVIIPSTAPVTSQSATATSAAMSMSMESKASQTPASRTPSKLRVMNNVMTILTGLVFVLVASKNSIQSGKYSHGCVPPKNRTSL